MTQGGERKRSDEQDGELLGASSAVSDRLDVNADPASSARAYMTPPGVKLGSLTDIVDGASRNYVVQTASGRFHGFIVRKGRSVFGYVDRCPHMGWPLAKTLDDYLTPAADMIMCDWHGALFDIRSGACIAGPCKGHRLNRWPVRLVSDELETS